QKRGHGNTASQKISVSKVDERRNLYVSANLLDMDNLDRSWQYLKIAAVGCRAHPDHARKIRPLEHGASFGNLEALRVGQPAVAKKFVAVAGEPHVICGVLIHESDRRTLRTIDWYWKRSKHDLSCH